MRLPLRLSRSCFRPAVCTPVGTRTACGLLTLGGSRDGGVLLVADLLAPMGDGVLVVDLVDGDVDHQPVRGGAVPVPLVGLDVDAIAGADDFDRSTPTLTQPDALGDEEALPKGVAVAGGAGAGPGGGEGRLRPGRGGRSRGR